MENRSENLSIRFREGELAQLREVAKREDIPVAALVRRALRPWLSPRNAEPELQNYMRG